MKKLLLLASLVLFASATRADAGKDTATPDRKIDSTLLAYYQWCTDNRQDSLVLLKADTMFRLAGQKNDVRMQCVAQNLMVDFYYSTQNLDSLKTWIPRVQAFARERNELQYYYFPWSRLILYYTKHAQYTLAQYELERYLAQAAKDDFKSATADAYVQLAHIYRTKSLPKQAAEYYRQAIDFILANDLPTFHLANYSTALSSMLCDLGDFEEALQALEFGKKYLGMPDHIWTIRPREAVAYARTGKLAEAKAILADIKANGLQNISKTVLLETEFAILRHDKQTDQALATLNQLIDAYKRQGLHEKYYASVYQERSDLLAEKGLYEAAFKDLVHNVNLYREKVTSETESSLDEFATLLDVNRLDKEKAQLQQQAQAEHLRRNRSTIFGLSLILLLAVAFIIVQIRSNRRLQRAKRIAEESTRMKGSFIRTITHEINTPLNAIVGFAELAATHPASEEERHSYIDIIRTNSCQLQKLVDDVLYISDLESTQEPPAKCLVDINNCCLQSIRQASAACRPGVTIEFLPGREQLSIHTSKLFLSKIINELLLNATQFTFKGSISLGYTLSDDDQNLCLSVSDTGPGIPLTEHTEVFERFVKLDPFSNGLGLGLSVCRLAAQSLGGSLVIDTKYVGGSRFILTIPIA